MWDHSSNYTRQISDAPRGVPQRERDYSILDADVPFRVLLGWLFKAIGALVVVQLCFAVLFGALFLLASLFGLSLAAFFAT